MEKKTSNQAIKLEPEIRSVLANAKLKKYIFIDIQSSLHSIGFSKRFTKDLIKALEEDRIQKFRREHREEIKKKYAIGFRQKIAPDFLENEVIPHIPPSKFIMDIGCGTGALSYRLSKYDRFKKIIGVDIAKYPEWKLFYNSKMEFAQIDPNSFEKVLKSYQPHTITLTWSLHHMPATMQKKYLQKIHEALPRGGKVIVLEDAYSIEKNPLNGVKIWKRFMKLNQNERQKVMSVLDWIANKVLSGRRKIPMPYSFRTVEEWTKLCMAVGLRVKSRFLGFPDKRDINVPQALLVLEK